jgi:hypothetical protein
MLKTINHSVQSRRRTVMGLLTSELVDATFRYCLFVDGEDTTNHVLASGILVDCGFHPERLKEKDELIGQMLDELPETFKENSGGGMSFLTAVTTKDGVQWTDLHQRAEQLFLLGMAAKRVVCLAPREVWSILPGGMPYYAVLEK